MATVEVKPAVDGWVFTYNGRVAGPFPFLNELDIVEVAAKLSGLPQQSVEEWKAHPRENAEKWTVTPKDVFKAKLRLYACISKDGAAVKQEYGEAISTRISKLDAGLVGKRVSINGQIVSEQTQKALPSGLRIFCSRCHEDCTIDLLNDENLEVLKSVIFKQGKELSRFAEGYLTDHVGPFCDGKSGHRIRLEEEGFMDYAVLGVRDLLEEMEKFDQQVYQARGIHLVGVKTPPSKKVKFEGVVVVDPISRDLCVLADNIRPLETQVAGFRITDSDRAEWSKWFNASENVDMAGQIAPDMVGRKIVQHAYLILLHSLPEIPDIHGKIIRGCLRALDFGDTKTDKSESAKDLTVAHYNLGGFIMGETSSRTGITYTIDTENKAVIWGELPNNDLGLAVIDGLHVMFSEEMKELRETLENQRITVRRFVSGEALARTRVIAIFNPNKSMNQYMYACMGLKDSSAFYDPPDITRWDIFLPFSDQDVAVEEIAGRNPKPRPIPDEVFKRHVYWAWSRRPQHVQYTESAKLAIVKESTRLMKEYNFAAIPIVHRGARDILCRFSVAQAALSHSTDETHTNVIVDQPHVEKVLHFYEEMLSRLHLREYKHQMEGSVEIAPSEFEEIVQDLGEVELAILNAIKVHSKGSPTLAAELDLSVDTIKRHYEPLRKHGFIITKPRVGVELTARGVQFLKASTSGISVSDAENATDKQEITQIGAKNAADTLIPWGAGRKFSVGEILGRMRRVFVEGTQEEWVALAVENGLSEAEAGSLFQKLAGEELFWFDRDEKTFWRWVRE